MTNIHCPACGHQITADNPACPGCGHSRIDGTVPSAKAAFQKPSPPDEVTSWITYKTPPEIIDEMRRTFDEAAFLAELRDAELKGGCELKDFIHKLEQEASRE